MSSERNESEALSQPYEKWSTALPTEEDKRNNRRRFFGLALGETYFGLVLAGQMAVFIHSISALWGWYFIDLFGFLMLLAGAVDNRRHLKMVLLRKVLLKPREAFTAWYFFSLVMVSALFNLVFLTLYALGIYEPPFRPHI